MSNPTETPAATTYTTPTGHTLPCPQPDDLQAARVAEADVSEPDTDTALLDACSAYVHATDEDEVGDAIALMREATGRAAMQSEIARLRTALEYYADHRTWVEIQYEADDNDSSIEYVDFGDTAREALKPVDPLTHSEEYAEAGLTPGPWAVETNPANLAIYAKDAPCIGNLICYAPEGFSDSMANWPANAAFIVNACNTHHELLAACAFAANVFDQYADIHSTKGNMEKAEINRSYARELRAILAKAKGQTTPEAAQPPADLPLTHAEQYAEAANRG